MLGRKIFGQEMSRGRRIRRREQPPGVSGPGGVDARMFVLERNYKGMKAIADAIKKLESSEGRDYDPKASITLAESLRLRLSESTGVGCFGLY